MATKIFEKTEPLHNSEIAQRLGIIYTHEGFFDGDELVGGVISDRLFTLRSDRTDLYAKVDFAEEFHVLKHK